MNQRTGKTTIIGVGLVTVLAAVFAVSVDAGGAAGEVPPVTSVPAVQPAPAPTQERPVEVAPVQEAPEVRAAVTSTTVPAAVRFDRMVLVGDSLADESAPVIDYVTGDLPIIRRHMGGTAPCDWLGRDLEATSASVVVITFTGNNYTPCMLDSAGGRPSGDRLVEKYRADATLLVEQARTTGAWVVLVGQPNHHPVQGVEGQIAGLNAVYRDLAERLPRVAFVDAGAAVEAADGSYTDRLPCTELDTDCAADGTTAVRGDGVHFCPVAGVAPCPVWSSGAVRFGTTIAAGATSPVPFD